MTLASVDEIVFIDFEFVAEPGERQKPVCLVAVEQRSGRVFRLWAESRWPKRPPFATGPNVLTVAYYASAELGCYLALGWKFPDRVLDLYAEFRLATNGMTVPHGRGLLGALAWFGLDAIQGSEKDRLRSRILAGGPYSETERKAILNYCESDVRALAELFPRVMEGFNDVTLPLLRGEFMKAIALAEYAGVPVDAPLYHRMAAHWPELQTAVIHKVNAVDTVFEKTHFRAKLFEARLRRLDIEPLWPRTRTGELALDEDTFRDMAAVFPAIEPLWRVRQMLAQMRKPGLSVGKDGRNRCLLSPYASKTGRCQPSTSNFIFGLPSYMRGLIRPEPGRALAYLDWEQQEFGIAAGLSGDTAMKSAYESGDPYLAFAKYAGAAPETATKESHRKIRELFKVTVLGTQYLIGPNGLACRLRISLAEAEDLLAHHRRIFRTFWNWSDGVSDYGQLYGELTAAFGWRMKVSANTSLRTLRNYPMQTNGAEMLRIACIYATRAGVSIIAPVHDAVLVEAAESEIEDAVRLAESAMRRASEIVLEGFALRTEFQIIRPPDRYREERGREMWEWMTDALAAVETR